jgi:immune inhibitor A
MKKMSFGKYLESIGFTNPADDVVGMDDSARFRSTSGELIDIPSRPVTGKLQIKTLLVDFPDRPGTLPVQHYEDMLFSKDTYLTDSMRDYYKKVSLGKVEVTGSVHGRLRMPNPYSYYTNNKSGFGNYPHNAPRLAKVAVNAALQKGTAPIFSKVDITVIK